MGSEENNAILNKLKEMFPERSTGVLCEHLQKELQTIGSGVVVRFETLLTSCVDSLLSCPDPVRSSSRDVVLGNRNQIPQLFGRNQKEHTNCASSRVISSCTSTDSNKSTVLFNNSRINNHVPTDSFQTPAFLEKIECQISTSTLDAGPSSEMAKPAPETKNQRILLPDPHLNYNHSFDIYNHRPKAPEVASSSSDSEVTDDSIDSGDDNNAESAFESQMKDNIANESSVSMKPSTVAVVPAFQPENYKGGGCKLSMPLDTVLAVVPDVDQSYAEKLLSEYSSYESGIAATLVCSRLLDDKNYPKKSLEENLRKSEINTESNCGTKPPFEDFSGQVPYMYMVQVKTLLGNEFPFVSQGDIVRVLRKFNYHFVPAVKYFKELLRNEKEGKKRGEAPLVFLKRRRFLRNVLLPLDPALHLELEYVKRLKKEDTEKIDHSLALKLNNEEYEKEGQLIECGCCYGEYPFEDMVQCMEGHLFCAECLRRYAQEAVFGTSSSILRCMTDGCNENFLMGHLRKCLNAKLMAKYEEREQEEALKLAALQDLVRCPGCDYAAELPVEEKVLKCQNLSCLKETCRYCKVDWADHFGIPCNEVEGKDKKNLRISYEEKMTTAKVRICPSCNCSFMKTDGCNKMTCRCGATMCYICRKPKITYNHFCSHLREPGQGCKKCKACSLWTDPTEDDERALRELKKEARIQQKRIASDENGSSSADKEIGPSLSPPRKKRCRGRHS